jgi:hypothetical protein
VSYRDDEQARTDRANALIDEIAELERQKVLQAANDRRLEVAKAELKTLQSNDAPEPEPVAEPEPPRFTPRRIALHAATFSCSAVATFLAYSILA